MTVLTVERAKELLDYDPETGVVRWKVHRRKCRPGSRAGCVGHHGYRFIKIDGKNHLEHRVAWAITHGEWPTGKIDHKNGDTGVNHLDNLRLATGTQNQGNRRLDKDNASGVKGVYWHKTARKWMARISIKNKCIYLGLHKNLNDARRAYEVGAKAYFGEFARTA